MDTLFSNYDNVLIQREEFDPSNFYGSEASGANQQRALSCIRYAIKNILEWTEEDALIKFDEYMIKLMKLDNLFKYINWPPDIEIGDAQYILSLLYPHVYQISLQKRTEDACKRALESKRYFPKDYFSGEYGFFRFCTCFRYVIMHYHPVSSLQELYELMLSKKGNKLLTDYRLNVPFKELGLSITKCIYTITPNEEHSEFYFSYYSFIEEMKKHKLLKNNDFK